VACTAACDATLEAGRILLTTDFVVDETLTLIRFRLGLEAASAWWQQIDGSARLRWERVESDRFERARNLFSQYRDKDLSFTDWLATISAYGPDNRRATKLVVGILRRAGQKDANPIRSWASDAGDVRTDPVIAAESADWLRRQGVKDAVSYDRIDRRFLGCEQGRVALRIDPRSASTETASRRRQDAGRRSKPERERACARVRLELESGATRCRRSRGRQPHRVANPD
jgi:hypothetical protein